MYKRKLRQLQFAIKILKKNIDLNLKEKNEFLIEKIKKQINDIKFSISPYKYKKIVFSFGILISTFQFNDYYAQIFEDAVTIETLNAYNSFLIDMDLDGDLDYINIQYQKGTTYIDDPYNGSWWQGPSFFKLFYRKNISESNEVVYGNPIPLINIQTSFAENAFVDFVDIDNDGDLDLLLNTKKDDYDYYDGLFLPGLYYLKNTGSLSNPSFTINGLTFISELNNDDQQLGFPVKITDINNDSFLDLFVPSNNGLVHYINEGSVELPMFINYDINPFGLNDFGWTDVKRLELVDIDGDNDLDMFSGTFNLLKFQENIGDFTNPIFSPSITNPFGILLNTNYNFNNGQFSDINNDNKLDFLLKKYNSNSGEIYLSYYKNTSNENEINFDIETIDPFCIETVSLSPFLNIGDLNSDGKKEIIEKSYYNDKYRFFKNVSGTQQIFLDVDNDGFGDAANPVLQDSCDFPIGYSSNNLDLNDSDFSVGITPQKNNYLDSVYLIQNINTAFNWENFPFDFDEDGDIDLIRIRIKEETGDFLSRRIYFIENISLEGNKKFSTPRLVFQQDSIVNYNNELMLGFENLVHDVTVNDIDDDGDQDLIFTFDAYKNDDGYTTAGATLVYLKNIQNNDEPFFNIEEMELVTYCDLDAYSSSSCDVHKESVDIVDLNGDGVKEFFVSGFPNGWGQHEVRDQKIVDFDNDNDLDFFFLLENATIVYQQNLGSSMGVVINGYEIVDTQEQGAASFEIIDFDNDNDFDLLFSSNNILNIKINTNNSSNPNDAFARQTIFPFCFKNNQVNSIDKWDLKVADFENDGDFDFFFGKGKINFFENVYLGMPMYRDNDNDGFGDPNTNLIIENCSTNLEAYVSNSLDCDDTNPTIYPGAQEIENNGIIEDCNLIMNVEANNNIEKINLFPNPGSDELTINLGNENKNIAIKMFNSIGGEVLNLAYENLSSINLNTKNLQNGIYFVEISLDGNKQVFKWVKK